MTDFITFGEAIQLVGFNEAARMMRRALGIKTLAPWPSRPRKPTPTVVAVDPHVDDSGPRSTRVKGRSDV